MDLAHYIDSLAARGRYHFTTIEAVAALGSSNVATRAALRRARAKGIVAMPMRGFHLIIPPEYRRLGCLPPDQFVPQLMDHIGLTYYVGLLSAAHLHGAAHQAPMIFQMMVGSSQPKLQCGHVRVQFVTRSNIVEVPTIQRNTLRGVLRLSTPEATAFDLVGYPRHSGGLSNVATVLSELAENMDASKLLAECTRSPLPWAQRLGYLLELVEAEQLAKPLLDYVAATTKEYVPLRTGKSFSGAKRDQRWHLLLNDEVEIDL
jgi:predicted transcriptional regulator of viral defense system